MHLMSAWAYISLIGAGLLGAVLFLRNRRRASDIRALAIKTGLCYLGQGIPKSFTLDGTTLESATSIWNVIEGDRHGIRIIAFDCEIRTGKSGWRRTVIATEANTEVLSSAAAFDPELTMERSGKWSILYRPKSFALIPTGLMPVSELEAHLNAVAG
jgi:hypothetical protein